MTIRSTRDSFGDGPDQTGDERYTIVHVSFFHGWMGNSRLTRGLEAGSSGLDSRPQRSPPLESCDISGPQEGRAGGSH